LCTPADALSTSQMLKNTLWLVLLAPGPPTPCLPAIFLRPGPDARGRGRSPGALAPCAGRERPHARVGSPLLEGPQAMKPLSYRNTHSMHPSQKALFTREKERRGLYIFCTRDQGKGAACSMCTPASPLRPAATLVSRLRRVPGSDLLAARIIMAIPPSPLREVPPSPRD
jgi:hypothetical protein